MSYMFVVVALQQMATGLDCYVCSSCTSPSGLQTVASGASGYSCTVNTDTFRFITRIKKNFFSLVVEIYYYGSRFGDFSNS
jgi:hypothetical protein